MAEEEDPSPGALERLRRALAWLAGALFVVSFVALLGLSATPYWTPENPWISFFDQVWKLSGAAALLLGSIPYAVSGARRALKLFAD